MAVTSGPLIRLGADIAAEFGATDPDVIGDFASEVGKTASAGQNLNFSDFYGAISGDFSLATTSSSSASRVDSGACRANWGLETDGDYFKRENNTGNSNGSYTDLGDWYNPKASANASDYEYRVGNKVGLGTPTLVGTAVTIPTGDISSQSWNSLSSVAEWYFGVNGVNSSINFKIEIKHTSSGDTSDVCTVTLSADGSGV